MTVSVAFVLIKLPSRGVNRFLNASLTFSYLVSVWASGCSIDVFFSFTEALGCWRTSLVTGFLKTEFMVLRERQGLRCNCKFEFLMVAGASLSRENRSSTWSALAWQTSGSCWTGVPTRRGLMSVGEGVKMLDCGCLNSWRLSNWPVWLNCCLSSKRLMFRLFWSVVLLTALLGSTFSMFSAGVALGFFCSLLWLISFISFYRFSAFNGAFTGVLACFCGDWLLTESKRRRGSRSLSFFCMSRRFLRL